MFNVVAIAIDDDLDFVVKTNDSFIRALLFLEGIIRNHEMIVDREVVVSLVILLEVMEALNDSRLLHDLIGEEFRDTGVA